VIEAIFVGEVTPSPFLRERGLEIGSGALRPEVKEGDSMRLVILPFFFRRDPNFIQ